MGPPGLISIPGRGTARGTAGGREWGAICCAPYSGLDLVDQAAPRWTAGTGVQSHHGRLRRGRQTSDGEARRLQKVFQREESLCKSPSYP